MMKKRPGPCDPLNASELSESGQQLKRQCLRWISPENNSCEDPREEKGLVGSVTTSLSLLPPGERVAPASNKVKEENGEENEDGGEGEGKGKEEESSCLLRMMQHMIAAEVRNYFDNFRADNRPVLRAGLGPRLDPSIYK